MSKSILFICPYPYDSVGSQRFRHELYFEALSQEGYTIEVSPFWNVADWSLQQQKGKLFLKVLASIIALIRRIFLLFRLRNFDLIYIHREAVVMGPPWFEWCLFTFFDIKVVYDFDDAIWLPDRLNEPGWKTYLKWRSKIGYVTSKSDLVLAGNAYLKEFSLKYNDSVMVLPTVVDTDLFNYVYPSQPESLPIIGWTGTHSTLRYLEEIVPQLKQVYFQNPFRLRVICDVQPDFHFENIEYIQWNKESESLDLEGIHLGLMPLPDDAWTRGKCGFKAIQYMAKGIPTLASAVGVNHEILSRPSGGALVYHLSDWESALLQWLNNESKWQEHSLAAREIIEAKYSKKAIQDKFIAAIKELI